VSKPVHPIRRLAWRTLYRSDHSQEGIERVIVRGVKPLLDALDELGHPSDCYPDEPCKFCRLLAAWRAKL
jgi:hypothetical protein